MSATQQSTTLVVGRDANYGSLVRANSEISPVLNAILKGHYVGSYPVNAFLDKFLPVTDKVRDKAKLDNIDFSSVIDTQLEKGMYEPFARAILSLLPKNAEVVISADETPDTSSLRPDMGVRVLRKGASSRHGKKGSELIREPFDFPHTDLCIEFKLHTEDDPFVDGLRRLTVESDSDKGIQTRGQLAHYAHEQFAQQHRCHLFQVVVFGNLTRFLYWDRSGAVVTERFNFVENPEPLAAFLWRYTRATDAVRGLDPTVSLATDREATTFREVLCDFINSSKKANKAELPWAYVSLDEAYPVSRIRIQDGGKTRIFFVSKAFYIALGPCGRCTRTFLACEIRDRTTFILKDTWEVKDATTLSEWSIYDTLEAKSVPSLLPRICGGEVHVNGTQQLTIVEELSKEPQTWRAPCSPMMRAYGHVRLVQDVAYPLQCLKNSGELVKVVYDVAQCIGKAKEAGVMHRDISLGNILFLRSSSGVQGVVIDWDHAHTTTQQATLKATFRSATRQFMSIPLLRRPDKEHEVSDDLESLFWVFVYVALHYVFHTSEAFLRQNHLFQLTPTGFSDPTDPTSSDSVITTKMRVLKGQLLENFPFRCTLFQELFTVLCAQWGEYLKARVVIMDYYAHMESDPSIKTELEKFSSASWTIKLFDKYRKKENWEEDDIVADQFPPMTAKDENKLLDRRLATTFDASHLPESVRTKAMTTLIGSSRQRFGGAASTVLNSPPSQNGKRLHEISDDSGEENEYLYPARKKAKIDGPPKPPVIRSTRSRAGRAKIPALPKSTRPSRSTKGKHQ